MVYRIKFQNSHSKSGSHSKPNKFVVTRQYPRCMWSWNTILSIWSLETISSMSAVWGKYPQCIKSGDNILDVSSLRTVKVVSQSLHDQQGRIKVCAVGLQPWNLSLGTWEETFQVIYTQSDSTGCNKIHLAKESTISSVEEPIMCSCDTGTKVQVPQQVAC